MIEKINYVLIFFISTQNITMYYTYSFSTGMTIRSYGSFIHLYCIAIKKYCKAQNTVSRAFLFLVYFESVLWQNVSVIKSLHWTIYDPNMINF